MTIQPSSLFRLDTLFALVLSAQGASGADHINKDMIGLLSRSPWTMQVDATMDDPADVPEISTEVPKSITQAGQPNQGTGNLDINTRWDGGISKNRRGRLATIPVVVRWDSAAVMRQALEASHEADVPAAEDVGDNYILTVVGLLPSKTAKAAAAVQPKSSSDDMESQAKSTEEIVEWFMSNSALTVKGIREMHPRNVRVDSDTGTVHLFFERAEKLESGKRDIQFLTKYGTMRVQARFRTKDMLVNGKPDL